MDAKSRIVCDVNNVVMIVVLSKESFIEFLTWTNIYPSSTKWLEYDILEKSPENFFALELLIDKSLAVFYKSDFELLMTVLGFVMPDFEVVCRQCKTKQEKNFDVTASCPKCGLEALEKVPVQKRERLI